jgi:hypothetical protein
MKATCPRSFSVLSARIQPVIGSNRWWVTLRKREDREIVLSRLYYALLEIKPELKKLLSEDEPDLTINLVVD